MKKLLRRLLSCFMVISLIFSFAIPSFAAFKVSIAFISQPATLKAGEAPVEVMASVNTTSDNDTSTKPSKYTCRWSSNNPAVTVTSVDGAEFPTATLQVKDTFGSNSSARITLLVRDTGNGNVEGSNYFDVTLESSDPIKVIDITPSPANNDGIYPVRVNDTLTLKAVAYYDDAKQRVANNPIEWTSSAPGIASVDKGVITGVTTGNDVTITVRCKDKDETIKVRVVDAFSVSLLGTDHKPVSSISLEPKPGSSYQLTAQVKPDDTYDDMSKQPITWTSTDSEVATVTPSADSKQATVTAGGKSGKATIQATVKDPASGVSRSASCVVTVRDPNLSLRELKINEEQSKIPTLVVGSNEETQLTASLTYYNLDIKKEETVPATSDTVEWTSSNPNVATVWSDGTVKAVKGGKTTITVTSKEPLESSDTANPKYDTDTREIIVNQNLKRITLSNTTKDLQIKKTLDSDGKETVDYGSFDLTVLHDPETAWPQMDFSWSMDKEGIVTVKENTDKTKATITAVAVGDVTITVTGRKDGKTETATCTVHVTKPVTGITLEPTTISLKKGETKQLTATLLPKDEVKETITWLTSDNRYVRVDNAGKITAVEYTDKPITITARVGQAPNPVYSATCTVTVGTTSVTAVKLTGLQATGPKTASVSLGSSLQLSAVVEPKTATNTDLIWSSSDENYATVNRNGKVTPQRKTEAGKPVTITVKSKENEKVLDTVAVTVTAHKVTGIRIEPADPVTLDKVGDTQQFVASLVPSTADDTVSWTLSGTPTTDGTTISNGVISLKSGGSNKVVVATGLTPGESDVLVKVGDFTTNTKVTVSGVIFEKSSVAVAVGRSEPIVKTLYGRAKNLNAKDWEWSSDNDSVARVNPSTGMVSGIKPGSAKITCKNGDYSAVIPVTVSESSATVLSYKMGDNGQYDFETKIVGDIRDQCKTAFDGSDLNYVTNLSVAPSQGTLYYGYVSETNPGQGVAASDRFYYKTSATGTARPAEDYRYTVGKPLDKLLSDVTFIPAPGFSGKADISYTAFAENGKDLAGSIQITVPTASEITYNSPNGEAVRFVTNDFSTLSQATSGYPISSVRFNAPSERYGYLYYEYSGGEVYGSNITSGQRFYASSTPSLDSVSFVPRSGYTGTFPITFTAWNTNGSSFTGTVRITVKTTGEGGGDITYTTNSGSRVYFDASDFQALCRNATGGKLNYIQFTALPTVDDSSSSSSTAVLYHGSGSGSRVGTSASIYASSSGSRWTIDNVYLLPSSSYTGQVTIPFKGWDTDRKTFEGTIVVDVTKDGGSAATIYMTCTGMPLVFRRADFDDACKDALPAALQSVRFQLPGRNSGTLYKRFKDLNDREPLAANQDIPAADLVTLSYLPKGESSGTVYLSYTATDEKGNICDGQVRITAEPNPVSIFFVDLDNTTWAIPSINFLRTYGVVNGKGKKRYQPNATLTRGDFVLMLARAFGFQLSGTESFPDVPQNSYYAGAIAAAKSLNLIRGSGQNGSFRPNDDITRQEAAAILFRVLQREQNLSAADTGYLTAFSDSGDIDSYAESAFATLIRDGIFEGSSGRLYPYAPLTRAQMAVILHRAIT